MQEKLYFVTKGEQYHLAVAAASIISRASFLEELDKASAEAGITLPSGAGTKSDQIAAKLLEKGGMPMLEKYAKLHFANTEKALNLLKNKWCSKTCICGNKSNQTKNRRSYFCLAVLIT